MAVCGDFGGLNAAGEPCQRPAEGGPCYAHGGEGPDLLSPEVRERIVGAVRAGCYLAVAARANGVSERTAQLWMAIGAEESEGPCADFHAAITSARAHSEVSAVAVVRKAATGWDWRKRTVRRGPNGDVLEDVERTGSDYDWRAAAWYLERAFPERWKENLGIVGSGDDGAIPHQVDVVLHTPEGSGSHEASAER